MTRLPALQPRSWTLSWSSHKQGISKEGTRLTPLKRLSYGCVLCATLAPSRGGRATWKSDGEVGRGALFIRCETQGWESAALERGPGASSYSVRPNPKNVRLLITIRSSPAGARPFVYLAFLRYRRSNDNRPSRLTRTKHPETCIAWTGFAPGRLSRISASRAGHLNAGQARI